MGSEGFEQDSSLGLDLQHLQAELARIDLLLQRLIESWRLAGQNPSDAFRGLYVSDDQARALMNRPLCTNWGNTIPLMNNEADVFTEALSNAEMQIRALENAAHCQGKNPRLKHLSDVFGLDRFERDAFLICLAPCLDQRYEKIYGYLQDDITRKRPSVNLILDLFCEPGLVRSAYFGYFADQVGLFKYGLLEKIPEPGSPPLLSRALAVDETIISWLLGNYQPLGDLGEHIALSLPAPSQTDQLLAGEILSSVESVIREDSLLVFTGMDNLRQDAAARLLAAGWKRPLLTVDLAALKDSDVEPLHALCLALRDARLTSSLPYLKGWDACLEEDTNQEELLAELYAFPHAGIIAGKRAWQPKGVYRTRRMLWFDFPIPAFSLRKVLWAHCIEQEVVDRKLDLSPLAGQFQLTSSQIRDAAASACDRSVQREAPLELADLFAAARDYSNPNLSSLARKIAPRYGWDDIVLPEDQLAQLFEIVATVCERPLVLDEWGLGRKLVASRGVTALFAGPPGTGKTMAAEILAAELGLDLYKIDLSTVVSKYIGETEKNLERIFTEAESSNAILFFDEADALFGKRSEVRDSHDRYANIEISYLLQRMEAYDGITILATNLRANLDEAFTRRLQFLVDFPFPNEFDRLRIWQALFPDEVPCTPELDFTMLAQRCKLAGGNIRNIIVSAAYLSAADGRCVTMEHLLHGARRELQKMGRLLDGDPLTRMSQDV